MRNLYSVFHSGYTKLHSHQHCMGVPFPPCPLQHLLFLAYLKITIFATSSLSCLSYSLTFTLRWLTYLLGTYYRYLWRRQWHPTPVLLPRKSHGRRSLLGCSPWDHEESDVTERLHFHFHFPALEKEMATHSSVLAWRIPGTG